MTNSADISTSHCIECGNDEGRQYSVILARLDAIAEQQRWLNDTVHKLLTMAPAPLRGMIARKVLTDVGESAEH